MITYHSKLTRAKTSCEPIITCHSIKICHAILTYFHRKKEAENKLHLFNHRWLCNHFVKDILTNNLLFFEVGGVKSIL